jgi:cell division protein FtsW
MEAQRKLILMLTGLLLSLGLVMVYSASFVVAERKFDTPTFFLERHGIYLLLGCIALAVASLWDYHSLARQWRWFLLIALALLLAVLIPGVGERINGARRWFRIGSLTFQPSELAKPLLVLAIATWAARHRQVLGSFWQGFLPATLLVLVPVALMALEPDLGTAGLTFAALSSMLFVAGIRLVYALPAILIGLPAAAWFAWSKLGYIQARIAEFFAGETDVYGRGYQVHQGLIALGSGGLTGKGLGQGDAKLLFLPEAHNDFILALIGEEFGLIGTLSVLFCFGLLVWQGWIVARRAPDLLGSLIALGVTLMIGIQATINFAVVTRSMPTKGISLPLISYGGSSLILMMFSIGLLLNVAAHPASDQEGELKREGAECGAEPVPQPV